MGDVEKVLAVAKDLVNKEGISVLELCPGLGHEDVGKVTTSRR